jgi:uncharacterized protein (DUF2164 family)
MSSTSQNENQQLVDNVAKYIERNLKIELNKINKEYYLEDHGAYAFIYGIKNKPNQVIRIEPEVRESFFDWVVGHDFKHVVKVYANKIIEFGNYDTNKNKSDELEITLMERLEPISMIQRKLVSNCFHENGEFKEFFYDIKGSLDSDEKKLINHIIKGMKELKSYDIYLNDFHGGNVMFSPKEKVYKLIDLSNV